MIESSSPLTRPAPLGAGVFAAGLAFIASIVEGYFWIQVYQDLADLMPEHNTSVDNPFEEEGTFLLCIVAGNLLIAVALVIGAVLAMGGKNGGRIVMWIAGGIVALWHVCCSSYSLLIRGILAAATNDVNTDKYSGNDFDPNDYLQTWQIDAAIFAGYTAAIVAILATILVAQRSVNVYFRALRPPPPFVPYPPGPYHPGW